MAPKLFVLRTAAERRRRLCLSWLAPTMAKKVEVDKIMRLPPKVELRCKAHLREYGLPVHLQVEILDDVLLALVAQPTHGFVHLVHPCLVK